MRLMVRIGDRCGLEEKIENIRPSALPSYCDSSELSRVLDLLMLAKRRACMVWRPAVNVKRDLVSLSDKDRSSELQACSTACKASPQLKNSARF